MSIKSVECKALTVDNKIISGIYNGNLGMVGSDVELAIMSFCITTELYSSNNREIFDNDIILFTGNHPFAENHKFYGVVEYRDGSFMVIDKYKHKFLLNDLLLKRYSEVIDNNLLNMLCVEKYFKETL